MKYGILLSTIAGTAMTGAALADPIEGNWRTQNGETAAIGECGEAYCIILKTGDHAGKRIGRLSGGNGKYGGTVTDPVDDRTYSGSATVSGANMRLKGCALKIFCKTQNWERK